MKKVLCFGTFDHFHPGHEYVLKEASRYGDRLTVLVSLDTTVEKAKGIRPDHDERQRVERIGALPYVDEAILGNATNYYAVLDQVHPDLICLGYDQGFLTDRLQEELDRRGMNTEIVRLQAYRPEKYKSSLVRAERRRDSGYSSS